MLNRIGAIFFDRCSNECSLLESMSNLRENKRDRQGNRAYSDDYWKESNKSAKSEYNLYYEAWQEAEEEQKCDREFARLMSQLGPLVERGALGNPGNDATAILNQLNNVLAHTRFSKSTDAKTLASLLREVRGRTMLTRLAAALSAQKAMRDEAAESRPGVWCGDDGEDDGPSMALPTVIAP